MNVTIVNVKDINNAKSVNSPWILSPDTAEKSARETLRIAEPSAKIETIEHLNDLNDLFSNPPNNCILFNTHGESFPKPD